MLFMSGSVGIATEKSFWNRKKKMIREINTVNWWYYFTFNGMIKLKYLFEPSVIKLTTQFNWFMVLSVWNQ